MVRIAGTGLYAPGEPIDNAELARLTGIEFDAERLEAKLGIRQRHIAHLRGLDETTADFAERAAREAIHNAGISGDEVDLFVVATDTPEYISPATSMLIQGRIQGGQRFTGTFDLGASCSSFVAALDTVARVVGTDASIRHACIVGAYNMPAYLRPGDAFGYPIFADGAAAVVLRRSDTESGDDSAGRYLGGQLLADGTQWDYVGVYAGGTRKPVTAELLQAGEYGLQLLQRLPGDRNVKLWPVVVERLLAKIGRSADSIDHFFFTQINRSVIEEVMGLLGQPLEKTTTVMDRYGYTGSACIPMALHTAMTEGRVARGDSVVMVASGAGLAVASSALVL
jgi:3-oxoacyl-[acyl-carrier-protein] synthase-3